MNDELPIKDEEILFYETFNPDDVSAWLDLSIYQFILTITHETMMYAQLTEKWAEFLLNHTNADDITLNVVGLNPPDKAEHILKLKDRLESFRKNGERIMHLARVERAYARENSSRNN